MGQPAKATEKLEDFLGLITNIDHHDLPNGAGEIQTNMVCLSMGQLVSRKGYREVIFENQ